MSSSSAAPSVSYNQLGLTNTEQQILRQHAQMAQQGHGSAGGSQSRGRGTAHSTSSSRAVSAASSQGSQRLMVDVQSLTQLQRHFDSVMLHIRHRIEALEDASDRSLEASEALIARSQSAADAEIARYRRMMQELERLDQEMDAIIHIRGVVKQVAERVRDVSNRLDRAGSNGRRR